MLCPPRRTAAAAAFVSTTVEGADALTAGAPRSACTRKLVSTSKGVDTHKGAVELLKELSKYK